MSVIPLPYQILGAIVAVAASFGFGYYKGIDAGRVAQLKDTVDAYETRQNVDANIAKLGSYDLCLTLPGVLPEQCDELRGLGKAPEGE